MDLIFDDDHVGVVVTWGRPRPLAGFIAQGAPGCDTGDDFLYLITAKRGRTERCVYVGQSYSSPVRARLRAPDHVRKQAVWAGLSHLAGCELQVRLGAPRVDGKGRGAINAGLVDDVEAILIYALDDGETTQNVRSRSRHTLRNLYEIRNVGLPRSVFPQRIGFGYYWDR